jgi:hypothetical protein
LLKLELNTNQSINQLIIQTGFHLHTIGTWDTKNRHSSPASFHDIYLKFSTSCQLSTRLYEKDKTSKVANLESKIQWDLCGELQCSFKRKKSDFCFAWKTFLSWKNYTPSPEKLNDLTRSDLLNIRHRLKNNEYRIGNIREFAI